MNDVQQLEQAKACYDEKDYSECLKYLQLSISGGNIEAKRYYSRLLDTDNVFREIVEKQNNLSILRESCAARKTEPTASTDQSACEPQNADALLNLGNQYYIGDGVRQDYSEAVKWYHLAAEQGQANAQYNLGVCFFTGTGISKNITEAVKWFRKAAVQGDAEAQYWLGKCYLDGNGVDKEYMTAVKWFRKAAKQGYSDAQQWLDSQTWLNNKHSYEKDVYVPFDLADD